MASQNDPSSSVVILQDDLASDSFGPPNFVTFDNNPHSSIAEGHPETFLPHQLLTHVAHFRNDNPEPSILDSDFCSSCEMLLGVIRNLRSEKELLEEEVTVHLRKLVTIDIQTEHVYLEVRRMIDHMIRVECDIKALRRNQRMVAEIPNDPAYVNGARMVVSHLLGRGLVSTDDMRSCGFSLFMEP